MRGATKAYNTKLTATNLHVVSSANLENNVTKSNSSSGARMQRKPEIVSGFSTPQRTLTPQSSCADLESASSQESSFLYVEPDADHQALPLWLQPAHGKTASAEGAGASLRRRGQQIATSTVKTHQDNLILANLRARGNAVLAATAVRHSNDWPHWKQPQTLACCPQSVWNEESAEHSPMKIELTSLPFSCIALPPGLAPPPGLTVPSRASL